MTSILGRAPIRMDMVFIRGRGIVMTMLPEQQRFLLIDQGQLT